mgnify:CR=1 FL=1
MSLSPIFVTRNYGETARSKVNALMGKLFKATGFVFVLVLLAFRAFKPAIVVTLVIPVVLLMTIFIGWLMGMTIDRVSLFALIFSIGILVDDAKRGRLPLLSRSMPFARLVIPRFWRPLPLLRRSLQWVL